MKSLGDKMSLDKYRVKKTKHEYQWQEEAEKLTKHFKQNCFWVFHKHDRWWINKAYTHCVEKNKPFGYFLGLLNGYSKTHGKLLDEIRQLYAKKDKAKILVVMKKFGWKLTDAEQLKIMKSINEKELLDKLRKAYVSKDYFYIKKKLREEGWLLSKHNYAIIIESLDKIKPTDLLSHGNDVLNND